MVPTRSQGVRSPPIGRDEQFVRFVDVNKSFDGKSLILKNINLDVRQGEFLTLLGPSGSGKTTALMLLAGFEVPTSGEIFMAGRSLHNVPPNKRDIGMVFQSYALFPHMTVAENLAFPLVARQRPSSEIKQRVGEALEKVYLSGYETRRPYELSGGQQQRIAVARALIFEPALVLMDEPLSALDRKLREQMQIEIKHIHERVGVTMVYVTHDQSEALVMSDRIGIFNEGVIEQLAPPRDLYREPKSSFVASFLGDSNLLAGTVTRISGPDCLVELDGGGQVRALAVRVERVGDRANVAVRSESVRINAADGELPNQFSATVEEVIYLGDHVRLRLRLFSREDFFVKLRTDGALPSCAVGDSIRVGWSSEAGRALDGAPQAGRRI